MLGDLGQLPNGPWFFVSAQFTIRKHENVGLSLYQEYFSNHNRRAPAVVGNFWDIIDRNNRPLLD